MTEEWLFNFENYQSVEDNIEDAEEEYERMEKEEFVVQLEDDEVLKYFPEAHLNKLAIIVNGRRNGHKRLIIVINMKRSGANNCALTP